MKSLNTIMKEVFREYLVGINVIVKPSTKLGELMDIVERHNSSCRYRASGMLSQDAVKKFEAQKD